MELEYPLPSRGTRLLRYNSRGDLYQVYLARYNRPRKIGRASKFTCSSELASETDDVQPFCFLHI